MFTKETGLHFTNELSPADPFWVRACWKGFERRNDHSAILSLICFNNGTWLDTVFCIAKFQGTTRLPVRYFLDDVYEPYLTWMPREQSSAPHWIFCTPLDPWTGRNRPLLTDEPVEFQDFGKFTNRFRGNYIIDLKLMKENRKMSTCNWLDLETLGSRLAMLKILPGHCIGWGYCKGCVLSGVWGDFWAQLVVIVVFFKLNWLHVNNFRLFLC